MKLSDDIGTPNEAQPIPLQEKSCKVSAPTKLAQIKVCVIPSAIFSTLSEASEKARQKDDKEIEVPLSARGTIAFVDILAALPNLLSPPNEASYAYYATSHDTYVSCYDLSVRDSQRRFCDIPYEEIKKRCVIRTRPLANPLKKAPSQPKPVAQPASKPKSQTRKKGPHRTGGRTRERTIEDAICKVRAWREACHGSQTGDPGRFCNNLQAAAEYVGVPKKTLDDYMALMRKGHKYGFNFTTHAQAKIGYLRRFLREQKKTSEPAESPESTPKLSPLPAP